MEEWISAALTGTGLLGNLIGSIFDYRAARKAQNAWANNVIAQTKYTLQNFSQQANANNLIYAQEQESAYQQQQQVYLQNLQQQATAQTSAAGAGISGNSIENLFRNYERASALSNFITERNLRYLGYQYDSNYEALRTNAINSIYGLPAYSGANPSSILSKGIFDFGVGAVKTIAGLGG